MKHSTECNFQEKKEDLLEQLVTCLDRERGILMELSIPDLWDVMEEKKRIVEAIESLPLISDAEIISRERQETISLTGRIDRLKEEITFRTKENVKFIQSSLAFVDGLISLLAGEPGQGETYSPRGAAGRRGPIYRREV